MVGRLMGQFILFGRLFHIFLGACATSMPFPFFFFFFVFNKGYSFGCFLFYFLRYNSHAKNSPF